MILDCPIPRVDDSSITMAHGGGGRAMRRLIDDVFLTAFPKHDGPLHDGALLPRPDRPLAFTTDSYVVHPLQFPGGDIGTLAINGTVNDLAMCGARPLYVSAGFLLEEGLRVATLREIACSMARAAEAAGVRVVTGDTKVVDRGKGDGIYINTAGVGIVQSAEPIGPGSVSVGDAVLLSGDLGRHGMAIMAAREELQFENAIESDCAPLAAPVLELISRGVHVHCLRDLTRGGLASGLVEIAEDMDIRIEIDEAGVCVEPGVRGACEILGLDPMYVANEGRFVCFLPESEANDALSVLRQFSVTENAVRLGTVTAASGGIVVVRSAIGGTRILDMLSGEQLPRIC